MMFPADFEYFAPTSLDEALSLLADHADEAKVMAGGQSLIPLMKLRFAAPAIVIDINRVPGLDQMQQADGSLGVGALVRNRALERSELLASRYPTMAAAAPLISDPIVRNQGTFVGSLCHADPQGDWASVMLAFGGEVVAKSTRGGRSIPIGEFLQGPFTTALEPDELATEARVFDPGPNPSGTYLKLERKVGDFATVGVAIVLASEQGRVSYAGIGLTGVGATNIKATEAEEVLVGSHLDDAVVKEAARLAAAACDPHSDVRGSAEYKRDVVRVFVSRGLRQSAVAQAA